MDNRSLSLAELRIELAELVRLYEALAPAFSDGRQDATGYLQLGIQLGRIRGIIQDFDFGLSE